MRQLSDLLDEARADAPPARYDVDDVVAAGRKRQRRRTAGWTIAAAAAVAVAIGVPQIVTRADPAPRPVAPVATTPAPTTPAVGFSFAGYRAGRFHVDDPRWWGLAGESAPIRKAGVTDPVGTLFVYRPGVDPFVRPHAPTTTGTTPVRGRKAYFVQPYAPSPPAERWLAWEYADDAIAVVEPQAARGMTDAELRQVAEGFTPGTPVPVPVRLPFRAGYVSGDYTLVDIVADPDGALRSMATFVPADQAASRMRQPNRGLAPGEKGAAGKIISIRVDALPEPTGTSTKTTCSEGLRPAGSKEPMGGDCERPLPGGKYRLEVIGSPAVTQREIRKMADALEVTDPAKPAAWLPVTTAIPASHLLKRY